MNVIKLNLIKYLEISILDEEILKHIQYQSLKSLFFVLFITINVINCII